MYVYIYMYVHDKRAKLAFVFPLFHPKREKMKCEGKRESLEGICLFFFFFFGSWKTNLRWQPRHDVVYPVGDVEEGAERRTRDNGILVFRVLYQIERN